MVLPSLNFVLGATTAAEKSRRRSHKRLFRRDRDPSFILSECQRAFLPSFHWLRPTFPLLLFSSFSILIHVCLSPYSRFDNRDRLPSSLSLFPPFRRPIHLTGRIPHVTSVLSWRSRREAGLQLPRRRWWTTMRMTMLRGEFPSF